MHELCYRRVELNTFLIREHQRAGSNHDYSASPIGTIEFTSGNAIADLHSVWAEMLDIEESTVCACYAAMRMQRLGKIPVTQRRSIGPVIDDEEFAVTGAESAESQLYLFAVLDKTRSKQFDVSRGQGRSGEPKPTSNLERQHRSEGHQPQQNSAGESLQYLSPAADGV